LVLTKPEGEAGATNIGAVFLLLAAVMSASLFAFALTHQGVSVGDRIASIGKGALQQTAPTITARGPVYVKDVNLDKVIDDRDTITFDISVGPAGSPVDLASIVTTLQTQAGRTTVNSSATTIVGDGDRMLESGETVELRIIPPAQIESGKMFVIQLAPDAGAPVSLSATMPLISDGLMTLYY
jgi:archaellin